MGHTTYMWPRYDLIGANTTEGSFLLAIETGRPGSPCGRSLPFHAPKVIGRKLSADTFTRYRIFQNQTSKFKLKLLTAP